MPNGKTLIDAAYDILKRKSKHDEPTKHDVLEYAEQMLKFQALPGEGQLDTFTEGTVLVFR
jgi:hypothetical protein